MTRWRSIARRTSHGATRADPLTADRADPLSTRRLVGLAALTVFAVVALRAAWVNDDAYITFRTIDNALHGHGLRWNVVERVQTYTHPLWLLLLTGVFAITREYFFTTIAVSMVVSLVGFAVLTGLLCRSLAAVALITVLAVSSRAFIDYATSGLENPLTHTLLVLLWWLHLRGKRDRRNLLALSATAGLLLLNRLDVATLILPVVALRLAHERWRRRTLVAAALFLGPIAVWTAFSLIYYGFPFPNTAYAKLGTGTPRAESIAQGLGYLVNALANDPVTLVVIGVAIILAGVQRPRQVWWPVAAGMLLQLAYVVWIGGDHMAGRFLTGVLATALAVIAATPLPLEGAAALAVVGGALGLTAPHPPLLDRRDVSGFDQYNGVSDERAGYSPGASLLRATRTAVIQPDHRWAREGAIDRLARREGAVVKGAVGYYGFFVGPRVYVIDYFGLGDPLLARLPPDPRLNWHVGHWVHRLPAGYEDSRGAGANRLTDPGLAAYFDHLNAITQGPVWSRDRLLTIWRFNRGAYDHLRDGYLSPPAIVREYAQVSQPRAAGASLTTPGLTTIETGGVIVRLPQRSHARAVELSVDGTDQYLVAYFDGEQWLADQRTPLDPAGLKTALVLHRLDAPARAVAAGYTVILIRPVRGDGSYTIGHLRVE